MKPEEIEAGRKYVGPGNECYEAVSIFEHEDGTPMVDWRRHPLGHQAQKPCRGTHTLKTFASGMTGYKHG